VVELLAMTTAALDAPSDVDALISLFSKSSSLVDPMQATQNTPENFQAKLSRQRQHSREGRADARTRAAGFRPSFGSAFAIIKPPTISKVTSDNWWRRRVSSLRSLGSFGSLSGASVRSPSPNEHTGSTPNPMFDAEHCEREFETTSSAGSAAGNEVDNAHEEPNPMFDAEHCETEFETTSSASSTPEDEVGSANEEFDESELFADEDKSKADVSNRGSFGIVGKDQGAHVSYATESTGAATDGLSVSHSAHEPEPGHEPWTRETKPQSQSDEVCDGDMKSEGSGSVGLQGSVGVEGQLHQLAKLVARDQTEETMTWLNTLAQLDELDEELKQASGEVPVDELADEEPVIKAVRVQIQVLLSETDDEEEGEVQPISLKTAALIAAAKTGSLSVVRALLEERPISGTQVADPSARCNEAIGVAAGQGHVAIVRALMLDPRIEPSDEDDCGLSEACENGHLDVVKFLIDEGKVCTLSF
jgi:hypothetical protein